MGEEVFDSNVVLVTDEAGLASAFLSPSLKEVK